MSARHLRNHPRVDSPKEAPSMHHRTAEAGLDIDFRVALIEAIPFVDHVFDLVTSSLMLHHLPDDLKRTGLAEIRRVLDARSGAALGGWPTGADPDVLA